MSSQTSVLATVGQDAACLVLAVSVFLMFYAYLGYPLLIWCLARCFGRQPVAPQEHEEQLPKVSVLIAAWNEGTVIEGRILNLLDVDYPEDKLEIVIASDGSQDDTCRIVQSYSARGVRLLNYQFRRGKAAVLNASVPELRGDIVMFSDANTQFAPDAVRKIARWFQEPQFGAVCGQLVIIDPQSGRNTDGIYWKYETFLKRCENELSALLGANGAIHAIRKCMYVPLPDQTIIDDLMIPLTARLKHGCHTVYDSEALAWEESPRRMRSEFYRRMRIGSGGFQSIGKLWRLLNPLRGWIALTYSSHKLARWICPLFLLSAFVSNAMLIHKTFFLATFAAQIAFYAVASAGAFVSGDRLYAKLLRITTMFTALNAAIFLGSLQWILGLRDGTWLRTERTPNPQPITSRILIGSESSNPHAHMFADHSILPSVTVIDSTLGEQQ